MAGQCLPTVRSALRRRQFKPLNLPCSSTHAPSAVRPYRTTVIDQHAPLFGWSAHVSLYGSYGCLETDILARNSWSTTRAVCPCGVLATSRLCPLCGYRCAIHACLGVLESTRISAVLLARHWPLIIDTPHRRFALGYSSPTMARPVRWVLPCTEPLHRLHPCSCSKPPVPFRQVYLTAASGPVRVLDGLRPCVESS